MTKPTSEQRQRIDPEFLVAGTALLAIVVFFLAFFGFLFLRGINVRSHAYTCNEACMKEGNDPVKCGVACNVIDEDAIENSSGAIVTPTIEERYAAMTTQEKKEYMEEREAALNKSLNAGPHVVIKSPDGTTDIQIPISLLIFIIFTGFAWKGFGLLSTNHNYHRNP